MTNIARFATGALLIVLGYLLAEISRQPRESVLADHPSAQGRSDDASTSLSPPALLVVSQIMNQTSTSRQPPHHPQTPLSPDSSPQLMLDVIPPLNYDRGGDRFVVSRKSRLQPGCINTVGVQREVTAAIFGDSTLCFRHAPTISARLAEIGPHTHLTLSVATYVIRASLTTGYFVEVGTFRGGSAAVFVKAARALSPAPLQSGEFVLHCIDTFLGDVAMNIDPEYRAWLQRDGNGGRPQLYDEFIANVNALGLQPFIVPHQVASVVGLRSIGRLLLTNRLKLRPDAIFVDSAHERNETLLELHAAYALISPTTGLLFGDDFSVHWRAVADDVLHFAEQLPCARRAAGDAGRQCSIPWPHLDIIDTLPQAELECVAVPVHLAHLVRVVAGCIWIMRKLE